MGLKTKYKVGLIAVGAVGLVLLAQCGMKQGWIPAPASMKAAVPEKYSVPTTDIIAGAPSVSYDLAKTPGAAPTGTIRVLSIPWNGVAPITYANGGAITENGSLVDKFTGAKVSIERQDDYSVIKQELLKFATGVKNGEANPQGAAFAVIMGDGYPAFISTLTPTLPKGQAIKVVGVSGFSYGEDKCMGPDTRGNPANAKGYVIAAVPYDGDWNICVKWASDNNIKVNVDQTTFDPEALNFVDTTSFTEADEKFVNGACEMRDEVKDGLKTGKKHNTCVNGVATWTPGDIAVVEQKGGIVTLASTKDYNQQMPAVIMGNAEWMEKNRPFVENLLKAIDRGSFDIRSGKLTEMGKTQAAVFGTGGGDEATGDFWSKLYVGYDSVDATGVTVNVGGSRAVTLAEVRDFFGLRAGSFNVYKGVYEVFGKYANAFYPKDVPSILKYEDVVDTSYITGALKGVNVGAAAQQFTEKATIKKQISNKAVSIEFDTGRATIKAASMDQLYDIANQSGMTGLRIRIDGHTDDTGLAASNIALSKARAQAVANWLTEQAPDTFPAARLEVRGYGSQKPKVEGTSAEARAANRRVEIILGN